MAKNKSDIDMRRVLASAIQAALDDTDGSSDEQSRSRGSQHGHGALKGIVAGVAIAAAARMAASKTPKLATKLLPVPSLSGVTDRFAGVTDRVRDRLEDWLDEDDDDYIGEDGESEDEEPEEDFEDEDPV